MLTTKHKRFRLDSRYTYRVLSYQLSANQHRSLIFIAVESNSRPLIDRKTPIIVKIQLLISIFDRGGRKKDFRTRPRNFPDHAIPAPEFPEETNDSHRP